MIKVISSSMIRNKFFISFFIICSILIVENQYYYTYAHAQQVNLSWSQPAKIPGLVDSGLYPLLITDSTGTLHVFNSQPVAGNLRIFYNRWTLENGWSSLVDIITFNHGDARVYGGLIDQEGWMHLTFFGGDDISANFYYTRAHILDAGKSAAWTEPVLIGDSAITPSAGVMVGDGEGFLLVVYSGKLTGNGLYAVKSFDSGKTWSSPEPIFLAYSNVLWPSALRAYMDPQGTVYTVWSVGDETGNSQAVYFARLDNEHQEWSTPIVIAEAIDFEADTPSIIKYNQQLILIYHNNRPTTRWMRLSSDNGETWSKPTRLFEHVGSNGAASLVIDSNNDVHMFFGNRIGTPIIHGAWHSQWKDGQWSNPEAIISGRQVVAGPNGEEGFDPSFLQSVAIRGNLLFVLWRHDPMAGPTNLWYSYQEIDAPQAPAIPIPTADATTMTQIIESTATLIPTLYPTIVPETETINTGDSIASEPKITNPNTSIFIGIVPAALLLLVIFYIKRRKH